MSTIKKGILAQAAEWAKHLRKYGKRQFWKRQRRAEKREIRKALLD
jgi:hypothetical protein